jgi:hypothetical protein
MENCERALEYAIEAKASSKAAHNRIDELKVMDGKLNAIMETLQKQKGAEEQKEKTAKRDLYILGGLVAFISSAVATALPYLLSKGG